MVLGIDLGTTYSVAAYIDENGEPQAIENAEGTKTTPSVVYFEDENNVVVGQVAKDFKATEPRRVVSTVKNVIGEDKEYKPLEGKTFLPQEISSFVLRKLVQDAEMYFGNTEKITDVIVTVPAYFNEAQRRATNEAVKLAGLNLISNINEPTAAAIFYAHKNKMDETNTLVFDLGGGTFDVTIMHIDGANVEVLSTQGLKAVGGSFFDQQLVDYICEQIDEKHGIDLEDEEYIDVYNGLYDKVETAKKQLCKNKSKTVVPIATGTVRDRIEISYEYFVSVISRACDKIENLVKVAISDAGLTPAQIDQVIMVGGSSRIPYVEEKIAALMGKAPLKVGNADEVVALGAAIQANRLAGKESSHVKDVCSHGIGFLRYSPKTETKANIVMIPRNTQLPSFAENNKFAFAADGQKSVKIVVTEGDYEDAVYAVTIKEVEFKLPKNVKRGMEYKIRLDVSEMQEIKLTMSIPELSETLVISLAENADKSSADNDARMEQLIAKVQNISIA